MSRCVEQHTGTATHLIIPNLFVLPPVCCISCCRVHNKPTECTRTTWSCSSRPVLTCCAYSCTQEGAPLRFTLIQSSDATVTVRCGLHAQCDSTCVTALVWVRHDVKLREDSGCEESSALRCSPVLSPTEMLDPEDESTVYLRNVGKCSHKDTASHFF
jgi:hypothetical protein